MSNEKPLIKVEALGDFNTNGLPDRELFQGRPVVMKGATLYMTQAQVNGVNGALLKVLSRGTPSPTAVKNDEDEPLPDRSVAITKDQPMTKANAQELLGQTAEVTNTGTAEDIKQQDRKKLIVDPKASPNK